jgi:carboxymethylenebutenolidase
VINPKLERYAAGLSGGQRYIIDEFVDDYEMGALPRRDLLERVLRITGSTAAAAAVLLTRGVKPAYADPLASGDYAPPTQSPPMSPQSVAEGDPAVATAPVTFASGGATIQAYLARPIAPGRYPAVMICHENAGISDHFKDVARRFAKNGYVGIALDLLSRLGGTEAVPANERSPYLFAPENYPLWVADFQAAMAYLRRQPFVIADRIGMMGFCFGGGVTWDVAIKEPTLRAAAPHYGNPMYRDEIPNMRAAILAAYGETDERTTSGGRAIEPDLVAARKTYRINVYPGAAHAFFNDTRPTSYHEAAATASWRDTLAWFGIYLRGTALPATGLVRESGGLDDPENLPVAH